MIHQKSDLIPASWVAHKTFVVPEPISSFEHRKRRPLIIVPKTTRAFLRVRAESKLLQQLRHWQETLRLINLRAQVGVVRGIEVTAHVPATSRSFANAACLSANVKPSTPQASEFG